MTDTNDSETTPTLPIDEDSSLDRLADDQRTVWSAYRTNSAFVLSAASSGTGKTTLASRAVADGIYRDLATEGQPQGLLFSTFTKKAAQEDRERVIDELETYVREQREAGTAADDPLCEHFEEVRTWLHTEADIRTLDSIFVEWYEEIARVTDLPMDVTVGDGIAQAELLDRVAADLATARGADTDLNQALDVLERRFGTGDTRRGLPEWLPPLQQMHQKCREFCKPITWGTQTLRESVDACFPTGRPSDADDIVTAVAQLSDDDIEPDAISDAWVRYAQETYDATCELAESLAVGLQAYADAYELAVREQGVLSHHDVTYLVVAHLDAELPEVETNEDGAFVEYLREKYDHVVIDEMQDTSYAQLRLLSLLFPAEMDGVEGLGIGDLKQSVYGWRSADPSLFAELVGADDPPNGDLLGVDSVESYPLEDSYRSHPHIIQFVNAMFEEVFADSTRGAAGRFGIPYERLFARRAATEADEPHIHVLDLPNVMKRADITAAEAEKLSDRLRGTVEQGTLHVDRNRSLSDDETTQADLQPMTDGDIALICRSKAHMDTYARELADQGFKVAVVSGANLFDTPEVKLLQGLLQAISDLSGPQSVRWLAESTFTTIDASATDRLAAHDYDIDAALEAVRADMLVATGADSVVDLEETARQLTAMAELREDVRISRHGRKADLLHRLVDSAALEPLLLGTRKGFVRNANVQRFIDVVGDWEDDEPLALETLIQRLDRMTSDPDDPGDTADGPSVAVTADEYADDTVLILTVHKAKGLEFETVVLPDLHRQLNALSPAEQTLLLDRDDGMAVRPWADRAERPEADVPGSSFENFWHTDSPAKPPFEDRGHTWISRKRIEPGADDEGMLIHRHPLSGSVADSVAEEWRVLYVAITRACDHLVLPLRSPMYHLSPGGVERPCDSWGASLWQALDLDSASCSHHEAPGLTGEGTAVTLPVSIDTLPQSERSATQEVSLTERHSEGRHHWASADGMATVDLPPAAPETEARTAPTKATPSSFYEWLEDPVSLFEAMDPTVTVRETPATVRETSVPSALGADVWGDIVHKVLELAVEAAVDPADLASPTPTARALAADAVVSKLPPTNVTDDLRTQAAAERRILRDVLPVVAASETYRAAQAGDRRLPEGPTTGYLEGSDAGHLWIQGEYDLLYRAGEWVLADFKTGSPPSDPLWTDHERFVKYGLQLGLYRWLLEQEHDISIEQLRLVYLWPEPVTFEIDIDSSDIQTALTEIIDGLPVGEVE